MVKPEGGRVLATPIAPVGQTKAGIILPDGHSQRFPDRARVVAVGPGSMAMTGEKTSTSAKVGDVVLYQSGSSSRLESGGEEFVLIDFYSILAIE